jgi:subtilase family serine protease
MRQTRLTVTALSLLAATAGLAAAPAGASAASAARGGAAPATAGPQHGSTEQVCPAGSRPGYVTCQSVIKLASAARNAPAAVGTDGTVRGYGPGDLRSAYGLLTAANRGNGRTVAIVDAYKNPNAASDLDHYRAHFGLGACTKASGCLHIINQNGHSAPLPSPDRDWGLEESLDLDMVSAICPKCHITLVEGYRPYTRSLGIAENTAAGLARYVSNSWSTAEFGGEGSFNHYFRHSGHAIVFASGDYGYLNSSAPKSLGTRPQSYPGVVQTVTSVGGTRLVHRKSGSRAWTETVWGTAANSNFDGTQSGCSSLQPKPSWQHKAGDSCTRRTQNDVAAIADPNNGVAVYDTYGYGGWVEMGGTSAATPIITATYALAGEPAARSYPASYIYSHPKSFHDIAAGANGTCSPAYLCHAEKGYDGPTGVGTPNGSYGLSPYHVNPVTLVDPGAKTAPRGRSFSLKISGLDRRASADWLKYTATGLPPGLRISGISRSTNGQISGQATAAGTFHVTVHAKDNQTGHSNTTHFALTVR